MTRPMGWKRDPVDARDADAAETLRAVQVPRSASNRGLAKILDQRSLGSCTSNSVAQCIRAAEIVAGAPLTTPFMSRLFAYYLARAYDGTTHEDAGTNIRTIFRVINKYGFPPESAWPYSDNTDPAQGDVLFDRMPSAEAFREAYDRRASVANAQRGVVSYAKILATGDARCLAIKQAIAARCLVAFGTDVSEAFCNGEGVSAPVAPPIGQSIVGGHAMCIVGYDGDTFEVANSWGETFAYAGFVRFSKEYIKWDRSDDFWIVRKAPPMPKGAAA